MGQTKSIAVVGAGLIGRKHVEAIRQSGDAARLHAIVDPTDAGRDFAADLQADWYPDIQALLSADRPDGILIATPNQTHVDCGLQAISAGIPALVEKPIASDTAEAAKLVQTAETAGVPLLVGHHRRYNPLIEEAHKAVAAGRIGEIVSVNIMGWLFKPDDYFDPDWRRKAGAGPVYVNLIHDIDLIQHLCGPITQVSAFETSRTRGHEVEDTAVLSFVFESGALGTANVSDTIVAPWSWELTARENPAYPATQEACYLIGGTHGSLELPALRIWHQQEHRSWWEPMQATQLPCSFEDPLVRQIRHFAQVIDGTASPRVSGRDGLQALSVIETLKRASRSGKAESVTREDG